MRVIFVLVISFFIVASQSACAADNAMPSPTFWWTKMKDSEKASYISGLCDAFGSTNSSHGETLCKPINKLGTAEVPVFRFCVARYSFTKSGVVDEMPGVREFERFFSDEGHSHLPSWVAIAAFNDKACGENSVLPKLAALQEKGRCEYQLSTMRFNRFPAQSISAQEEVCKKLR